MLIFCIITIYRIKYTELFNYIMKNKIKLILRKHHLYIKGINIKK